MKKEDTLAVVVRLASVGLLCPLCCTSGSLLGRNMFAQGVAIRKYTEDTREITCLKEMNVIFPEVPVGLYMSRGFVHVPQPRRLVVFLAQEEQLCLQDLVVLLQFVHSLDKVGVSPVITCFRYMEPLLGKLRTMLPGTADPPGESKACVTGLLLVLYRQLGNVQQPPPGPASAQGSPTLTDTPGSSIQNLLGTESNKEEKKQHAVCE